jgi:hypothetical protein
VRFAPAVDARVAHLALALRISWMRCHSARCTKAKRVCREDCIITPPQKKSPVNVV